MKYLHYNVLLMTIAGLYKIETESSIKRLLFGFWRATVNLSVLLLIISIFIDLRTKDHSDFRSVVVNYIYLIGSLLYWLRMTYLVVYDGTSFEIVREMQSIFKYTTDTGVTEKDLEKYISFTNKFTFAIMTYVSLVGYCFVLLPLVNSSERKLSLPIWYPLEWKSSPSYELAVFLQIVIQQVLVNLVIAPDTFFATGMILLAAQFRLLAWDIKHVLHKTLLRNKVDLDVVSTYTSVFSDVQVSPLGEFVNSVEFRTELTRNLTELIKFYQSLVHLCARFDHFFSPVFLMYFAILLVNTVFIEYNIITAKDMVLVLVLSMILSALLFTMFLQCYLGNFLTSQAEELIYDIYGSPWYLCDHNFKTNLKILHHSSCTPIRFTIGKFGFLSLDTFVWIIKASVSYLAVLRQVTSDR